MSNVKVIATELTEDSETIALLKGKRLDSMQIDDICGRIHQIGLLFEGGRNLIIQRADGGLVFLVLEPEED